MSFSVWVVAAAILSVILAISALVISIIVLADVKDNKNKDRDKKKGFSFLPDKNGEDSEVFFFKKYLKKKLKKALLDDLQDRSKWNDPLSGWKPSNQMGIGIYIRKLPGNRTGGFSAWSTVCGGYKTSESLCEKEKEDADEPSFYFGSGTKPLTSAMVVRRLYFLWEKEFRKKGSFFDWFDGGDSSVYGCPPAVSFGDLHNLTGNFASNPVEYTETLVRPSNTLTPFPDVEGGGGRRIEKTVITRCLQDWIYGNSGLFSAAAGKTRTSSLTKTRTKKTLSSSSSSSSSSCVEDGFLCPILPSSLSGTSSNGKCRKPLCPASMCDWAWRNSKGKPRFLDPSFQPFRKGQSCQCVSLPTSEYGKILRKLTVFDLMMMRGGIPDSDSVFSDKPIDTTHQLASRTSSIGPIAFVSELLGFDWDPRWGSNKKPVTASLGTDSDKKMVPLTANPPAGYSSSGYTFLGTLLWLLDGYESVGCRKERRSWWEIDLNRQLPFELYSLVNFAGTSGNRNREKYFRFDEAGNRYYSFEATVTLGGVVHPDVTSGTPIGTEQTSVSVAKVPIQARVVPRLMRRSKIFEQSVPFVDWDSSSGVSCGNAWGRCSDFAQIYLNIFSPDAPSPIIPRPILREYLHRYVAYDGPNAKKLNDNQLRAPYCLRARTWSQGKTYNLGTMGPDWFFFYDNAKEAAAAAAVGEAETSAKKKNKKNYGIIPCYGHFGSTYGFASCNVYIPGGTMGPYTPLQDLPAAYSDAKNWNLRFQFVDGSDFAISCAQNSNVTSCFGAVQKFLAAVIADPFVWEKN